MTATDRRPIELDEALLSPTLTAEEIDAALGRPPVAGVTTPEMRAGWVPAGGLCTTT